MLRRYLTLPRVLLGVALALFVAHFLSYGSWLIDDAAISMSYARSLAAGDGLVLYPGAERVEAYSNPLWVFLQSLAFLLGIDPTCSVKALGLVAGIGTLVGLARLGKQLSGQPSRFPVGETAALCTAAHPPFAIWAASGLETPLFACLMVWSCERLVAAATDARALRHAGALFFLLALTRPEGILYLALAVGAKIVLDATDRSPRVAPLRTQWIGLLVPVGIALIAYELWHYHYFATWVTNTYFVKQFPLSVAERLFGTGNRGWQQVHEWAAYYRLLMFLPLGLGVLVSPGRRSWLFVAVCVFAALVFQLHSNGDWMREYRFLSPAMPLVHLLIVGGAVALVRQFVSAPARLGASWIVSGVLLVAAIGWIVAVPSLEAAERYRSNPDVSVADVRLRADHFRRARAELRVEGDLFLDPDLGGTSLYSGMRIVDTEGLADVPLALHSNKQTFVTDYVINEVRPDFAHIFGYWASKTHILQDPRWTRDFVALAFYRMRSGRPDNDNFVRRSLLQPAIGDLAEDVQARATFDSGLELVDARFEVSALPPGGRTRLMLFWRVTQPWQADPRFVVRLTTDGAPSIVLDHSPFYGWVSVRQWRAGEIWREVLDVQLPSTFRAGSYRLAVRVADAAGGTERSPTWVAASGLPSLIVDVAQAQREVDALVQQARSAAGEKRSAAELLRRASSVFPEDSRVRALAGAADSAWREDELQGVEFDVANGNVTAASAAYRAAYWRWRGDARVRAAGERLGAEAFATAKASQAAGQLRAAFENYLAAVTFDPRLSAARRRAEGLRLHLDPPRAGAGSTDSDWVANVEVGTPATDRESLLPGPVARGASVVCKVEWVRTEPHTAVWLWYSQDGEQRFRQTVQVAADEPRSWVMVRSVQEVGSWLVEVRVGDAVVATRRFEVRD